MGEYGTCRSCRAQVYWTRSAKSGKPMPLEEDAQRGNVLIDEAGRAHVFGDHAKALAALAGVDVEREHEFGAAVYISHHATCPRGQAWQGKKRSDPDAPKAEPQGTLLGSDEPTNAIVGG